MNFHFPSGKTTWLWFLFVVLLAMGEDIVFYSLRFAGNYQGEDCAGFIVYPAYLMANPVYPEKSGLSL